MYLYIYTLHDIIRMGGTLPEYIKAKKFDCTFLEQYILRTKWTENKQSVFSNHTLCGSTDNLWLLQ